MSVCNDYHRYFVSDQGTVEGETVVKIWAVVICTACRESHLIEHVMDKFAAHLTKKEK